MSEKSWHRRLGAAAAVALCVGGVAVAVHTGYVTPPTSRTVPASLGGVAAVHAVLSRAAEAPVPTTVAGAHALAGAGSAVAETTVAETAAAQVSARPSSTASEPFRLRARPASADAAGRAPATLTARTLAVGTLAAPAAEPRPGAQVVPGADLSRAAPPSLARVVQPALASTVLPVSATLRVSATLPVSAASRGSVAPLPAVSAARSGHPEVLAYWAGSGSNAHGLSDLRQHASSITWLSPYWYTLRGNATLLSRGASHAALAAAARSAGVPVLALVNQGSGLTGLLSTAAGRQRAVSALTGLLRQNAGLGGLVLDFELLPASSRAALTALVQSLHAAMPSGDTLGVAVMPKASSPGPGYARVFNYTALGKAADFLQLMTYDRHASGSAPGPVSPNNWAAQVARYAASRAPADKLLLGVPGYGYDWLSGTTSATTVNATQAAALAASHGVTPTYDPTSGEDHFTYRNGAGRLHTVWFESAQGVAGKAALVKQLGLGGLALWTLGGEQPSFWPAAVG